MEATWNGALFSAATIRLPVSTLSSLSRREPEGLLGSDSCRLPKLIERLLSSAQQASNVP
jgi:hypothetical protein